MTDPTPAQKPTTPDAESDAAPAPEPTGGKPSAGTATGRTQTGRKAASGSKPAHAEADAKDAGKDVDATEARPVIAKVRPAQPGEDTEEYAGPLDVDEDDADDADDEDDEDEDEDEDDEDDVATHRRRPGLVLPVVAMLALLGIALVVGAVLVPEKGPDQGAAPPAGNVATSAPAPGRTTDGPPLPTNPPRPADGLADWAGRVGGTIQVPTVAIQAYAYAQLSLQRSDPSCVLGWTTLAGLGEVESHHGQADGAILGKSGRSTPALIGPALDGASGRQLVRDSDAGAFDGDASYDHAMGPLRLLPSQWRAWAIDADNDGISDPYDIDDASMAVARLLCSGNEDLSQLAGWNTAVGRLRSGDAYAKSVFAAADSYGQRTRSIA